MCEILRCISHALAYIVVLPYIMCVSVVEICGTSVAINFFLQINSASTDENSVLGMVFISFFVALILFNQNDETSFQLVNPLFLKDLSLPALSLWHKKTK